MTTKYTSAELIDIACTWAIESMDQMIAGTSNADGEDLEYRNELIAQRKAIRAYQKRRFGVKPDPFAGATLVSVQELSAQLRAEKKDESR